MTTDSKHDLKRIMDEIRTLARDDRKTMFATKVGDNPASVDAALTLIESLCAAIRQRDGLACDEPLKAVGAASCKNMWKPWTDR